MSEIKEFAPSNQSKPYTIEDWHREYDGRFLTFEDYDREAELEAWRKWYSLPENDIKKDLPTLKRLSSILSGFKELNQKLDEIKGSIDANN